MAQNEEALWEILTLLKGHDSGWTTSSAGQDQHTKIENGYPVGGLKGRLVLKFLPVDIEDTIYFMKHRDYLVIHGQGMIMPEAVYSLTEKAISVLETKQLPKVEKEAFRESLWNIEPKLYGMGA